MNNINTSSSSSTLKKRILTASILIPIVILSIFYLPSNIFMWVTLAIFLWSAWEWTLLSGLKSLKMRLLGLLFIVLIALLLSTGYFPLKYEVPVVWAFALVSVLFFSKLSWIYKTRLSTLFNLIMGACILFPACMALIGLQWTPKFLLYVMVLIWGVDTGAYFAGKRFGKHKLAPLVSPGKTWEGVIGGLLVSFGVAFIAYFLLNPKFTLFPWLIISLVTAAFSIIGDLYESLFKRLQNLKDSGTLLPGHGGLLDRIDSLLAAVPIFWLFWLLY